MDKLTLENSKISMKNWNKWEDSLDDDHTLADAVANDFKNADDAIDFINSFLENFDSDDPQVAKDPRIKEWKDNIKEIKEDQKNGYDLLYNDNEGSTSFMPVDQPYSLSDFKGYDEVENSEVKSSLPESAFEDDEY